MHPLLLNEVIKACTARQREGDCPVTAPYDRERLEDAVVQLAAEVRRLRGLAVAANLRGFDPTKGEEGCFEAGVLHPEAPQPASPELMQPAASEDES